MYSNYANYDHVVISAGTDCWMEQKSLQAETNMDEDFGDDEGQGWII